MEPLSRIERLAGISPVMDSMGFFEEDEVGGKWDLLDTCTHLFLYDGDLVDGMAVYSNMVLDKDIDREGLKFLTVTVIKETDDWVWVIADQQTVSWSEDSHEISMVGVSAWRCDQMVGLLAALSSPGFRSLVAEWHGNYRTD